jgi:uncharacterized protein (DUF736 family)
MAEYDNTNRGVLFRNDKKEDGDKRPDYKGTINFNGVDTKLAGWIKVGKNGNKFLSLKVETEDRRAKQPARAAAPATQLADDEIPF